MATAEKPSGDAVAFADIEMPAGALSLPSRFSRLVDGLVTMCEHRLWARRAVQAGARLARRHAYDAVIVSSPPHEHHVAGLTLARLWRVPCLADFRDPWALALPHGFADIPATYNRLAERLERRIHREATVVVHNTGPVREAIATIPGCVAKRRASIPNGYDDAPEADTPPAAETFEIVFAGHIYGFMDVRVLLRAVRTFLTDSRIDRSKVRLTFLGTPATLWERPFAEILAHYGLRDCASIRERVNRSEALTIQRRAAVLVVFDYPHPLSVPMKFYDYLQSGGELLLFSRPGSALALAASKVDRTVVEPEDAAGAVAVLHRAWEKWSQCAFPTHQDPHGVHHRRERIAEVDALLRELTGAERA
ncbi:glycosyltransferase [Gemmatimonas sp.]|uniref:glycosyltransferase n=1 Tax=Gemmatimonas sp. TaxID=1962908 RepID=UPI0037BF9356